MIFLFLILFDKIVVKEVDIMNIKENMIKGEKLLSKYATKSSEAIRLYQIDDDFRPDFYRDIDRIIYSLSYERYMDKTQVFTNVKNDHISKRMIHVQLVSKIARTIGRALNLNEDLIEAIALGHDIGHVPFGHKGEKFLNDLSVKYGEGNFYHNVQSVRNLMFLENNGKGSNLCIQTLDGIMSHNGEIVINKYEPVEKSVDQFLKEYTSSYFDPDIVKKQRPMTLEGCVVRISDVVGYLGRDVEDAIRLGKIKKEDLPDSIISLLGSKNGEIVDTIILNIINNSIGKNYIEISPSIFKAINDLKDFNYKNIYLKTDTPEELNHAKFMFEYLFETYFNDLNIKNEDSSIYKVFLNDMDYNYLINTSKARMVIDFIAGMTDDFFIREFNNRYISDKKNLTI